MPLHAPPGLLLQKPTCPRSPWPYMAPKNLKVLLNFYFVTMCPITPALVRVLTKQQTHKPNIATH
jgi:hypothetical protein